MIISWSERVSWPLAVVVDIVAFAGATYNHVLETTIASKLWHNGAKRFSHFSCHYEQANSEVRGKIRLPVFVNLLLTIITALGMPNRWMQTIPMENTDHGTHHCID